MKENKDEHPFNPESMIFAASLGATILFFHMARVSFHL